ncbi:SRPBCC family protein [Kitasatospora purpeofusca]|uniref:SRPBCC family protein n=1 Tax=Kitasatospora purpeofusca TaxID=67352 RepID=UPI00365963F9
MATIHLTERTHATPEQFVACLTDFGPGRRELFGNSADEYLKVHTMGSDRADVTEGSGGIWERLHYDWSDPHRVVMTIVDSNIWGGASGHTYTFTPLPDGTTRLDAVVVREGKNLRGRLTGLLLGSVGKGVLAKALKNTVKAVEARPLPPHDRPDPTTRHTR